MVTIPWNQGEAACHGELKVSFHEVVPPTGFEPVRPITRQGILSPPCLPFHHGGFFCKYRGNRSLGTA